MTTSYSILIQEALKEEGPAVILVYSHTVVMAILDVVGQVEREMYSRGHTKHTRLNQTPH